MDEELAKQLIASNLTLAFLTERNRLTLRDIEHFQTSDPDASAIWEEVFSILKKTHKALDLLGQGHDPSLCEDET